MANASWCACGTVDSSGFASIKAIFGASRETISIEKDQEVFSSEEVGNEFGCECEDSRDEASKASSLSVGVTETDFHHVTSIAAASVGTKDGNIAAESGREDNHSYEPNPETSLSMSDHTTSSFKSYDSDKTSQTSNTSPESVCSDEFPSVSPQPNSSTIFERYALSIACSPLKHITSTLAISAAIVMVCVYFGNLQIQVGNKGFMTRNTKIADRSTQISLAWSKMESKTSNEMPSEMTNITEDDQTLDFHCSGEWYGSFTMTDPFEINFNSVWKTIDADSNEAILSALDADALYELCVSEENTLSVLEDQDVCYKCPVDGESKSRCLQPYSLAGMARVYLNFLDGILEPEYLVPSISCDSLRTKWTAEVQDQFTSILMGCSNYLLEKAKLKPLTYGKFSNCFNLPIMTATLVDNDFLETGLVKYTSSIYATKDDAKSVASMYNADSTDKFNTSDQDNGSSFEQEVYEVGVNSLYSTAKAGFYELYMNEILPKEAAIAIAATAMTSLCILLHTRSPFLTLLGLIQIILALPWAYFVYQFIFGISFFPFVNINALFVVFALGADDIFVATDKWKTYRRKQPLATTEQLAKVALPDAAYATFVTSITTSVAFFASAVVKVPAVSLFSVYCGLVIVVDYLLCILLVFPSLCLYDKWLNAGSTSRCLNFGSQANRAESDEKGRTQQKVEHILSFYYTIIHKLRWPLLLASLVAIVACSFAAAQLKSPDNPDQPFLPQNNAYEIHRTWSKNLLSSQLGQGGGGSGIVSFVWGLISTDTGSYSNPDEKSQLVFDSSFNPREPATQEYILNVCNRIYAESSLRLPSENYSCVLEEFDSWLNEQSQSNNKTEEYRANCRGADSVPVSSDVFDACMIAFSDLTSSQYILHDEVSVKVLMIQGRSSTTFYSPFDEQMQEWKSLDTWSEYARLNAPTGADGYFFSGYDFWVYDTLNNSRESAYKSALIALACASSMILLTSQSILISLFSAISIAYVLVASTACLVSLGWTLGMFESILFGILIGVGVDFVLHFAHAYSAMPGSVSKNIRTKHAILHMGPSVIGSAFTTLSTAIVMLFAENLFIYKFGMMLIMTIVHSVIGSFVVFLVLCDCIGPSEQWAIKDYFYAAGSTFKSIIARWRAEKLNDDLSFAEDKGPSESCIEER